VERLNLTGLLEDNKELRNSSRSTSSTSSSNSSSSNSSKVPKAGLMQKRRSIVALDDTLSGRPYGIALHNRQLFYTEFVKGRIVRLDLDTNQSTILMEDLPHLFELKVLAEGRQPGATRIRNDCSRLGCEELCLLIPGGARCACRQGFRPAGINGTACREEDDGGVVTPETKAKSRPPKKEEEEGSERGEGGKAVCGEGEVACSSGNSCISRLWICDGDMVSVYSFLVHTLTFKERIRSSFFCLYFNFYQTLVVKYGFGISARRFFPYTRHQPVRN
jgi:hypothetical protein